MPTSPLHPTPAPSFADRLGEFAAAVDWSHAPVAVQHRTRAVVADVLATAVAALQRSDVAALRDALAVGEGPSSVIGSPTGLPPSLAAFINAIPIAREQLQDGHRRARGHPGAHVVPAVLAVAEALAPAHHVADDMADHVADGTAVLTAILAGYETGVRIGLAMDGTPSGVHDIGTWALLGAAAGVAHLLSGGDAETIAAAIDIAAALPIAPCAATVFDGSSAQDLYLPTAVQAAVVHGQAAAAGLRSSPRRLEEHFAPHLAADPDGFASRLMKLLTGPQPGAADVRWTILEGYLKRHPTCALLHGVNDAVEDLVAIRGAVDADAIDDVRVRTYGAAAGFSEAEPANDMAARFSIPWTVAAGLTLGTLTDAGFDAAFDAGFDAEALADPVLRRLARRVRVQHDPVLDEGYPAGRPAVVTLTLRDGTVVEVASTGAPRGDGPNALEDPVIVAKPATLLSRGGASVAGAAAILSAVEALATDGVAPLAHALRNVGEERTRPASPP